MTAPLRIRVIDDNPCDVALIGQYLQATEGPGCQVQAPPPGADLRAAARAADYDLLILDYHLRSESGAELLHWLRATGDTRPVVVITGSGSERVAAELGRLGADDYLPKSQLTPEHLQRALRHAQEQAERRREAALLSDRWQQSQKLAAVGTLAGGLAHDFNNMLASIMGFAELAQLKYERGQAINRELEYVRKSCRQMADVLQQLVRFSMHNSPEMAGTNLVETVDDTVAVLRHSIAKHIRLELSLPSEAIILQANAAMLQQILLNLCINAADAMPEGGTLRLSLTRLPREQVAPRSRGECAAEEYVRLVIADTGCGIPADLLPRIFEPFFTTKTLSSSKGTGLGLATVWHNVRAHQGTIEVASTLGRGTTFTIHLPILPQQATPPPAIDDGDTRGKGEEVLVVDDEPLVADMAAALLEELGYQPQTVHSGTAALQTVAAHPHRFAALVLDISMPDMDGRETFLRLQGIAPHLPVLFATGHDPRGLLDELGVLGVTRVIQKPFILADLARQMRAVVARQN